MGPVRTEVMWQAAADAVTLAEERLESATRLDILDLGGGTGGDAVRLAKLGHNLTVVDPSPDALASLHRRVSEADLNAGQVKAIVGDTADLFDHVETRSFDLVICHGVIEHIDDASGAVGAIAKALKPAGILSLAVSARLGTILSRALSGDFEGAIELHAASVENWDFKKLGQRRYVVEELESLLTTNGFAMVRTYALRTFVDHLPPRLIDAEPAKREMLLALEQLVRAEGEFTSFSAGLQAIARLDWDIAQPDRGDSRAAV